MSLWQKLMQSWGGREFVEVMGGGILGFGGRTMVVRRRKMGACGHVV